MIRDELRTLWVEPRVPDPPARAWPDWALAAVVLTATAVEAVLRENVPARPVSVLLSVGLCLATLWRRSHPLATVLLAFGAGILITLVETVLDRPEPAGLYTSTIILVLAYALLRWGSGRDIVIGCAVIVTAFVMSIGTDDLPVGEQVGGFVFLSSPALLGASVRLWSTARRRELERMRSHERAELARELHDTVAHHVSAIVIRAQAGRVLAGVDPANAVEALEGIEEEGARTLEAMRAMVVALRHGDARAELTPLGGVADLERLARPAGGRLPIDLRLDDLPDDLPPAVDAAVFRIVQESVTNAVRHAVGATEVVVRVTGEADRLRVTIRDDGAPAGAGASREGYGLTGLRERATLLGGVLRAGPGTGRGWLVEAELPLPRKAYRGHPRAHR